MKEISLGLDQFYLKIEHFILLELVPVSFAGSVVTLGLVHLVHDVGHE
jgi:hypothetical protein